MVCRRDGSIERLEEAILEKIMAGNSGVAAEAEVIRSTVDATLAAVGIAADTRINFSCNDSELSALNSTDESAPRDIRRKRSVSTPVASASSIKTPISARPKVSARKALNKTVFMPRPRLGSPPAMTCIDELDSLQSGSRSPLERPRGLGPFFPRTRSVSLGSLRSRSLLHCRVENRGPQPLDKIQYRTSEHNPGQAIDFTRNPSPPAETSRGIRRRSRVIDRVGCKFQPGTVQIFMT